jgi:gamma-glutamylcyclotransferase (GGCT)/AIG2-like uncharacterized protein YtfP
MAEFTKSPLCLRVFVYGTLKPGEANYQRYCAGKVVDSKKAFTLGKLFALPMGYPAMIPGKNQVHGYLLSFTDMTVLKSLDELEDYQQTNAVSDNLYNRERVEIYHQQSGSLGLAWVYLMTSEAVSRLGGVFLPDGWWSGTTSSRSFMSYE